MRKNFFCITALILLFIFSGAQTIEPPKFPNGILIISQEGEHVTIPIEIADTEELRSFGLMYRKDIPFEYGMLFVFPTPGIRSFWMKNTFVELDIAFINSEGIIIDIQRMEPCQGPNCPIYTIYKPFKYALEVKAGFFERYSFSEGAKIEWIKSK